MLKNVILIKASIILFCALTNLTLNAEPSNYLGKTKYGEEVHIDALKGKVVVVSFWASWCTYCMKEMPILGEISKRSEGFVEVIAVNVKEDRKIYSEFSRRLKKTGVKVTWDRRGKISDTYNVKGLPHLVIFDTEGDLAYTHKGYGKNSLKQIVNKIIEPLTRRSSLLDCYKLEL